MTHGKFRVRPLTQYRKTCQRDQSGSAMVLGKLPVPDPPTNLDNIRHTCDIFKELDWEIWDFSGGEWGLR